MITKKEQQKFERWVHYLELSEYGRVYAKWLYSKNRPKLTTRREIQLILKKPTTGAENYHSDYERHTDIV